MTATAMPSIYTASPVTEVEFLAYDAAGNGVFNGCGRHGADDGDDGGTRGGVVPDRGDGLGQEYLTATVATDQVVPASAAGGGGHGEQRPSAHRRAWARASSSSGESCWSEDQPEMVLA